MYVCIVGYSFDRNLLFEVSSLRGTEVYSLTYTCTAFLKCHVLLMLERTPYVLVWIVKPSTLRSFYLRSIDKISGYQLELLMVFISLGKIIVISYEADCTVQTYYVPSLSEIIRGAQVTLGLYRWEYNGCLARLHFCDLFIFLF